jgi:hypothetical protein
MRGAALLFFGVTVWSVVMASLVARMVEPVLIDAFQTVAAALELTR